MPASTVVCIIAGFNSDRCGSPRPVSDDQKVRLEPSRSSAVPTGASGLLNVRLAHHHWACHGAGDEMGAFSTWPFARPCGRAAAQRMRSPSIGYLIASTAGGVSAPPPGRLRHPAAFPELGTRTQRGTCDRTVAVKGLRRHLSMPGSDRSACSPSPILVDGLDIAGQHRPQRATLSV